MSEFQDLPMILYEISTGCGNDTHLFLKQDL